MCQKKTTTVSGAILEKRQDLVGSEDPYCVKANENLKHMAYAPRELFSGRYFVGRVSIRFHFPMTLGRGFAGARPEVTPYFREGAFGGFGRYFSLRTIWIRIFFFFFFEKERIRKDG